MQPYGFIYLTRNTVNGMMYVGQARYRKSLRSNYFGSGKAIKRAIIKYGIGAFTRTTVFEAFTADDLNWAERQIISDMNAVTSNKFYNIAPGGRASLGFTGKKHTKERNTALSAKMQGHQISDKVRKIFQESGKIQGVKFTSKLVTCPHCKTKGSQLNMRRWHFDKCKHHSPALPIID